MSCLKKKETNVFGMIIEYALNKINNKYDMFKKINIMLGCCEKSVDVNRGEKI